MKKLLIICILILNSSYAFSYDYSDSVRESVNRRNQEIQQDNIRKQNEYNRQMNNYLNLRQLNNNNYTVPPSAPTLQQPLYNRF